MAESWKGSANKSLDDDFIRKALKAELSELKASHALFAKTLEKCREEVMKPEKPQRRIGINSLVFRYGGVLAACLLVVVLALNLGLGNMNKDAQYKGGASGAAEPAASAEPSSYSKMAAGRAHDEAAAESSEMAMSDGIGMEDVDAPNEVPAPSSNDQLMGLASYQGIAPEKLESIAYGSAGNHNAQKESVQAVMETLVADYNDQNGTRYGYESEAAFIVTTVADGGLSVESLKSAQSFRDLLGTRSYWVVPLMDQNGTAVGMLPFFSTGTEKSRGDEGELNVAYTDAYGAWAASKDMGLPYNSQLLEYLKAPETDAITVVDIYEGLDYVVFLNRNGTEYGIPFMTVLHADTLMNGRLYTVREIIDGLTEVIAPGNAP